MDAYRCYELDVRRYHLNSSSWSVHGAYEETSEGQGCLEIRHGYSKAHRPDLKQFVVEMICCNDGDVPLAFEVGSGNQSDKAVFGDRLKAFAQQWDVDGMLVADSALYSRHYRKREKFLTGYTGLSGYIFHNHCGVMSYKHHAFGEQKSNLLFCYPVHPP